MTRNWNRIYAELSLIAATLSLACVALILINLQTRSYDNQGRLLEGLFLAAIAAVFLGAIGRKAPRDGSGAGWCGWIGMVLGVLILIPCCGTLLLTPIPGNAGRIEFSSNMRQIALALKEYGREEGRLPPAIVRDETGRPLYSWRVLILPYLREYDIHKRFHLDEPWDSPHNSSLLKDMPLVYERPGDESYREGRTAIEAVSGPGTAFDDGGQPLTTPEGTSNVTDGPDRTLLLVETERSVPWTAPTEVAIRPDQAIPPLGGGFPRQNPWFVPPEPPSQFCAVFIDGSCRLLDRSMSEAEFRALGTRNGGEPVVVPD